MADLPPLDAALLDESMPGTPTSVQLRETQTAFEDTAEDLKHTMKALAASQADLTAMEAERDEARLEAREWRAAAEQYLTQRDDALHDLARAEFELKRRITVARADAGACFRCDGPIVRSQAVEPQPGTTKGSYSHVECPDPTPTKES